MIFDRISNWPLYFKNPKFSEVFTELNKIDAETPNGTYNFDGFYFKVMTYDTLLDGPIIESHRKEVDIQILLSGYEGVRLFDSGSVSVSKPYDSDSDCEFYNAKGPNHSYVVLQPGYMGVFFPQDIHNPQLAIENNPANIKKIVIKVDEVFFTQ